MTNHNPLKLRCSLDRLLLLAACMGLFIVSITVTAAVEPGQPDSLSNAATVVTQLHTALIGASRPEAGTLEQRYTSLEPVITGTHDLPYIGRFSMRRYWSDLTENQQAEFIDAFSQLSIATYASRFADVTDETFGISGKRETAREHIEVIGTLLQNNGETLNIIYVLHQSTGNWRIINILVDGVSDLALKRAEYQLIYTKEGFPGLIDFLSVQTAEFMRTSDTGFD